MGEDTIEPPIHTLAVDPIELAKCTDAEIHMYFENFVNWEKNRHVVRRGRSNVASACVDLDKYDSLEDFIASCRKIHKGNAIRDAMKANRIGYYSKFFDYRSYAPDVVAINKSTPLRGGVPMTHYARTVEHYGGYPTRIEPEAVPNQAAVWIRRFGVFRSVAGHCQGDVVCDEQLVSYISLRRSGNYAAYSLILGHADHLDNGIMYKMHLDLVGLIIAARDQAAAAADASLRALKGIRYLRYAAYYNIRPGLLVWKKRMLFEPIYVNFDYLAACPVRQLLAAAEHETGNMVWQAQCARLLAATVERCRDEGRDADEALARAALAGVVNRLRAHATEISNGDDRAPEGYDDPERVVVVGPTARRFELVFDPAAPALTYPPTGTTTGPSPVLRCDFANQDSGTPVDIIIQSGGEGGDTNFRLKLDWRRHADLRKLGIALPPGQAKVWAVHRQSPDAPWAAGRRVDLRIDPDAPNATDAG